MGAKYLFLLTTRLLAGAPLLEAENTALVHIEAVTIGVGVRLSNLPTEVLLPGKRDTVDEVLGMLLQVALENSVTLENLTDLRPHIVPGAADLLAQETLQGIDEIRELLSILPLHDVAFGHTFLG